MSQLYKPQPDLLQLRTFASTGHASFPEEKKTLRKFGSRAQQIIFLGYAKNRRAYVVYVPAWNCYKEVRPINLNKRNCCRGVLVTDTSFNNFSPVVGLCAMRFAWMFFIAHDYILIQADVQTSFLFARGKLKFFFSLLFRHPKKDGEKLILASFAALYGLKDSPKIWHSDVH